MKSIQRVALALAVTAIALHPSAGRDAALHAQSLDELPAETRAALEEIRAATEKYQDVEVALADGYLRDPIDLCVLAPDDDLPVQVGGMGIHYFRPDLLGITVTEPRVDGDGTHTDFLQPAILIYVPDETGSPRLAAVENLVWEEAWKAAGNEGPPEFHGFQYWHRVDNPVTTHADEAHMFEPHYELHVWLYQENPAGLFAQFNPKVTCEHHDGPTNLADAMARMQETGGGGNGHGDH